MKRLLRSKPILSLVAFIMIATAVVIPLTGSITHSFAASRSSHNIAYVNYDDSGFTGSSIPSANIFTDAIVGGPSPTGSPTDSVTYNGMTFTPLAKAALSSTTLAAYDTLILFEVCDIATSLTASQHSAINAFLAAGNKILLYDADRCAASEGGVADYSWFTYPFSTSSPGPQGASGTLTIVENSTLTQGLSSDPFNSDELGDANTATTSDPHWFAAAKTTNALGNSGYFLAYARNAGLIIYDGADHWYSDGATKSLTDLFLNELNQQYDPDNLPSTTPIASGKLFVFIQGIDTSLSSNDAKNGIIPTKDSFGETKGIYPSLKAAYPTANFLMFSYNGDTGNGTPKPYMCQDTFTSHLVKYATTLNTQITDYLNSHPGSTSVYLISHSMGGAVAFVYLAYLETKGWPALPNSSQLKGVITLDSPIGGVSDNPIYSFAATKHYRDVCSGLAVKNKQGKVVKELPLNSLDDLMAIFKTDNPFFFADPHGGKASVLKALFPKFSPKKVIDNQQLAGYAKKHGVSVLTVENTRDFIFDPGACPLGAGGDFDTTQRVADAGANSGVYGRTFDGGIFICLTPFNAGDNHLVVLADKTVETGLLQFLPNGSTPNALKPAS